MGVCMTGKSEPTAAGKSSFDLIDAEKLFRELTMGRDTNLLDVGSGVGNYSLAASESISGCSSGYNPRTRACRRESPNRVSMDGVGSPVICPISLTAATRASNLHGLAGLHVLKHRCLEYSQPPG